MSELDIHIEQSEKAGCSARACRRQNFVVERGF